jgi:hypothetical protein
LIQPREADFQYVAIQEEYGVQRLILRRGRDVTLRREIAQKRGELRCAHLSRVALAVKQDEAPDPLHICLLGTDAVVPKPDHLAHLIEQARGIPAG